MRDLLAGIEKLPSDFAFSKSLLRMVSSAYPNTFSLVPWPYHGAVSNRNIPRSKTACLKMSQELGY